MNDISRLPNFWLSWWLEDSAAPPFLSLSSFLGNRIASALLPPNVSWVRNRESNERHVSKSWFGWREMLSGNVRQLRRRGDRGEVGNKKRQGRAALPAAFEGHKECRISTAPGLTAPTPDEMKLCSICRRLWREMAHFQPACLFHVP